MASFSLLSHASPFSSFFVQSQKNTADATPLVSALSQCV